MTRPVAVRVVLVDDHPAVRAGVSALLEAGGVSVVAEAADGPTGIALVERHRPDVTVLDLQMDGPDGLAVLRELRARWPDAKVLVLSAWAGDARIRRVLDAGACGYVQKTASSAELLDAIHRAHRGERVLSSVAVEELTASRGSSPLTAREVEVLTAVARGLRNVDAAQVLGVSAATVKEHLKHISRKLGAADRTEAVTIALRRGFLEL